MMPKELSDGQDKVTEDYPGFVVHDGRVSGSITLGHSRLPIWCFVQDLVDGGYDTASENYPSLPSHASSDEIGSFLHDLLEHRREFARLICVLADVERREREARWNRYGPKAVFQLGGTLQNREELGPAVREVGLGPMIPVDPEHLPAALQPWYSDPENTGRVRIALRNCLDELDRLEPDRRDKPRDNQM